MGHCFSCFNSFSESSATSEQGTSQSKNESTEYENKVALKMNCVTLEPLMTASNDTQRNGNKSLISANSSNPTASNSNVLWYKPDYCAAQPGATLASSNDLGKKNWNQTATSEKPTKNDSKMSVQLVVARSTSSVETRVNESKISALFHSYKDANEDAILTDGIEKLCNDLQLSPDEFQVLVLAWKLNAEQMCCFTRKEFTQGLRNMKVDSIKALQSRLPEVVTDISKDNELFKDLYRFTFKFGLDVAAGQRILPVDVAIVLWRLVFTLEEPPILSKWLQYLRNHPHIRGIPKDTWYMFLNFCDTVGVDLSTYDDTEAWPSLFDDFVEYQNDQMNQNITKNDTFKISD